MAKIPQFAMVGMTPTKKSRTVLISAAVQVAFLLVLLLLPLLFTQRLPTTMLATFLVAPPPPAAAPPPPPKAEVVHTRPKVHIDPHMAPARIPKRVVIVREEPPSNIDDQHGVIGGVPNGDNNGVMNGILGGVPGGPPPPPPPHVDRIRQGGNVTAAKLIHQVKPNYPALAVQTHIQGVVHLHAIVSKTGTIESLEVISGHPLLVRAAEDAVRQWRYSPTLLNGEAVEVDTTIDVVFNLDGAT